MSQSHSLELPEEVFEALIEAATTCGLTPAAFVAERLSSPPRPIPTDNERTKANERLFQNVVSIGHATGSDNRQIDDDLVREAENHTALQPVNLEP